MLQRWLLVFVTSALCLIWACSGRGRADLCEDGTSRACTCQQGRLQGLQMCQGGTSWSTCQCEGIGPRPEPPTIPEEGTQSPETRSSDSEPTSPKERGLDGSVEPLLNDRDGGSNEPDAAVETPHNEPGPPPERPSSEPPGADVGPDTSTPEPPAERKPLAPLRIYLATNGKDTNSGLSASSPIKTIQQAHAILIQRKPQRDVEIRIAPGSYYRQSVVWTYTMPGHTIRFMPAANDKNRPIFDGCASSSNKTCPGGTWLTLRHSKGQRTNLHFEYIQIQRYQTAISLNGDRNAATTSNSHNRLYGCVFKDIGNVFNASVKPSTAAVRLVNSDDNTIANNHFVNVVNLSSGGLIHAIYVAHMSDRNQISRNRFNTSSGDPIRIRDFSNNNVITNNRFTKVATSAAYTEWYCNHDTRSDCTKKAPECPSWENQFRDNLLDGDYQCSALSTWKLLIPEIANTCKPVKAGAKRLYTSGNTKTSTPCSQ